MKCPQCHQLNDPELHVNKRGEVLKLNPRLKCIRCSIALVLCYDSLVARFRWKEAEPDVPSGEQAREEED